MYSFLFNNTLSRNDDKGLACGSGWTDKIIPDKPAGFDFTKCCVAHDKCYGNCKTKPPKFRARVSTHPST